LPQSSDVRIHNWRVVGDVMAARRIEDDVEMVETAEPLEERAESADRRATPRQQIQDVGVEAYPRQERYRDESYYERQREDGAALEECKPQHAADDRSTQGCGKNLSRRSQRRRRSSMLT
jgi:hypothetical protein